jgi:hypothetical protein
MMQQNRCINTAPAEVVLRFECLASNTSRATIRARAKDDLHATL